jgi:hypothetical protein
MVYCFPLSVFSWLMRVIAVDHDGQHLEDAFTVLHTAALNEAGRKRNAGGSLKMLSLWWWQGLAATLKKLYTNIRSMPYKIIIFEIGRANKGEPLL